MKVLFLYSYEYLEPIGIMSLSAFLKKHGIEVGFLDMLFEKDLFRSVEDFAPDIIAYSITTGKHRFYRDINLQLKQRLKFVSVFGGPHATFFPDFIQEEGVDILCRGEGEYALLELVTALSQGASPVAIKNLWVKADGEVHKNEMRPLIENLDDLPFVDRELVNKYDHYRKMHRRMVLTGRGCPYKCSYCFNHAYNNLYAGKGTIVRKRSVDHVLAELKQVVSTCKPRRFHFIDDTFIINKKWCDEFGVRYPKEIGIPFIAYMRVNLITDDIVRLLKNAGCITALYAIESGNDRIRNSLLQRGIARETILGAAALFKKYRLRTYSQNMVALPGETIAEAIETVDLNRECKPDYAWCSIYQPYPMTDLGKFSMEQGYIEADELDESYYESTPLKHTATEKRHLENLHHLFSVFVAFSFARKMLPFLIRLPLTRFYFLIWHMHRLWCYVVKVNWIDFAEIFIWERKSKGRRDGV